MTGVEPDEIIDADQWIDHQGGYESWGEHMLKSFAFLGALAYGLSEKEEGTLRPKPGAFRQRFNQVCAWFALIVLSPFIIALIAVTIIVLINLAGGDHNSMWAKVCDWAGAEGGWCG